MRKSSIVLALAAFGALAIGTPAIAQQQRSEREAAQSTLDALALYALAQNAMPRALVCARLKKAGMTMSSIWEAHCANKLPPASTLACLKGYFACEQKEAMAGAKMPPGGTFDCDNRLQSCKSRGGVTPAAKK